MKINSSNHRVKFCIIILALLMSSISYAMGNNVSSSSRNPTIYIHDRNNGSFDCGHHFYLRLKFTYGGVVIYDKILRQGNKLPGFTTSIDVQSGKSMICEGWLLAEYDNAVYDYDSFDTKFSNGICLGSPGSPKYSPYFRWYIVETRLNASGLYMAYAVEQKAANW